MKNKIADVRFVEVRKMTEFNEQASKVLENPAKNLFATDVVEFGKGHPEILKPRFALPSGQMKSHPRKGLRSMGSETAGESPEKMQQRPGQQVFQEAFNTSAHP
jgi:hypothetical protein